MRGGRPRRGACGLRHRPFVTTGFSIERDGCGDGDADGGGDGEGDSDSADGGGDAGGLEFPDCQEPDYWDFLYFSYTLGMTFQTSDVQITARRVRKVAIGQCLAAFVFNLGVLAFTINVLGGG